MPKCLDAEERLLAALPAAWQARRTDTPVPGPVGLPSWLHSVEVPGQPGAVSGAPPATPVVFLPGFGTGGVMFATAWRRLLTTGPWETGGRPAVVAVDPLGTFLSGRPQWRSGQDVRSAEAWFADSLEAWREARGHERMHVVGHSLGGHIAVAYAERYPERVGRLVLVSPAGVPGEPEGYDARKANAPLAMRTVLALWNRGWAPQDALRMLPGSYGWRIASSTAHRWSRRVSEDVLDRGALSEYIFHGWSEGMASGERALGAFLRPGAWGKRPLSQRIPALHVPRVEMIYGAEDWMDVRHGNGVSEAAHTNGGPEVWVQLVPEAGHYLYLDNVPGFCDALHASLGDRPPRSTPAERLAAVPSGFAERWKGPNVPAWRGWEMYDFGK